MNYPELCCDSTKGQTKQVIRVKRVMQCGAEKASKMHAKLARKIDQKNSRKAKRGK